jgi:hypothetical protein
MNIPTDEQFFSKTEKGKPDIAYLKNHFYREGRLKEEHALYIIEKATEILHTEPNLLHVDAPVTGVSFDPLPPMIVACFVHEIFRQVDLIDIFRYSLRRYSWPIRTLWVATLLSAPTADLAASMTS